MQGWEMQGTAGMEGPSPGPLNCMEHPGDREVAGRGGRRQGKQKTLPFCCPLLGSPPAYCQWGSHHAAHTGSAPQPLACRDQHMGESRVKSVEAEPQSRVWDLQRRESPAYPRANLS